MTSSHAILFGGVGAAVLFKEDGPLILEPGVSQFARPCREGEVRWLQQLDASYVEVPAIESLSELRDQLIKEEQKQNALFFCLASFDIALPASIRLEAAQIVDDLLNEDHVKDWITEVVLTQPLRHCEGTLDLHSEGLERWTFLKKEILDAQPALRHLWDGIRTIQLQESAEGDSNVPELVEELIFTKTMPAFTKALSAGSTGAFNQTIVNFSINGSRSHTKTVASRLLARLRYLLEQGNAFGLRPPETSSTQSVLDFPRQRHVQIPAELSTYESFNRVRKQIEGVKKLLFAGNRTAVDKAVDELVAFQNTYSEREHLAKTLCSLTKIALDANEPHIADTLSAKAIELSVDDIVVLASRAEVLKGLARFDEAKAMYESALHTYGNDRYALCGYADVLKDRGELDSALRVYGTALELYPDDPVASNGIVGVLLAQKLPDRALQHARKSADRFGDSVSRTVLGGLLRQVGRYDESVRIMEAAVRDFASEPKVWAGYLRSLRFAGRVNQALTKCDDFIDRFKEIPSPLLMKGELLRAAGEMEQSLRWYNRALRAFPNHRPAQIGKASILIILQRSEEAESLLDFLEPQSEIDWIAYHALCLATHRAGKHSAAIEKLEWGRQHVPWINMRIIFSRSLGYVKLRQGKPKQSVPYLLEGLEATEPQNRNLILLLLGSAYFQSGKPARGKRLLQMSLPTDRAGQAVKTLLIRDAQSISASSTRDEFDSLVLDSLLAIAA